ncbi:hypothetical protein SAMN05660461_2316 [Chitinophaga ginsengisegetis]|uniref:PIN domain-containing protein n=1 Tax=Chitinophaga ginsengisegetis TaxID=393003 RepID=A0A1T5NMJ3_9BACT|nr:hypothetical protein [Chitinophaga ginsengisegetis]SKD01830.1 hypothetical protein SAMN05660461_2316 [Chitinophaga ginsengisegetis]
MSKRKGIKVDVMRQLLVRTGNQCAFPDCTEILFTDDNVYVGNYCHINAVNELGKRYDSSLSEDYINSTENILVLCTKHHKIIDTSDQQYTVTRLKDIKREHEQKFSESAIAISDTLLQEAIEGYYMSLLSGMDNLLQGQKNMNNKLDILLTRVNSDTTNLSDISIKLEEIKVLRETGKFNSAIKILKLFKDKNWQIITDEHKYKIHLNIALCHLELAEAKLASEYLLSLETFSFEPENKWGLIAIGHLYNNDIPNAEKTAQKAIVINQKDINAYTVLIKCKNAGYCSYDEVITNISTELLEKTEIQIILAQLLENENRFDEALVIYNDLLEKSRENTILINALRSYASVCLLKSISNPELIIMKQLHGDVKDRLVKTLGLFNEAIDFYKSTELLESHWYLITNRGLVKKMLGKYADAEKDFHYSLEIKKEYLTYKHLIVVNLQSDKVFSIIEEARKLDLNEKDSFELMMMEVSILHINDKMEEAYKLLKSISVDTLINEEKNFYYNTLAENLITTGLFIELEELLKKIENNSSDEFTFNYYNARLSLIQDRKEDYQKFLLCAKEILLSTTSLISERYSLIQLALKAKDFKNCIEIINPICNKNEYTELSKKLIYCLINDGQHKEALHLIELYIEQGKADEFLIECISNIYDNNGATQLAISYLENYLSNNSNNTLRIRCAMYNYKVGHKTKCLDSLNLIFDIQNLTLEKQFTIASLYVHSGDYEKAFEIAYYARNSNTHKKKAHEGYISILMNERTLPEEYHFPKEISVGCHVLLENGNDKKEFIIVDTPRFYNEVGINEDIAIALLEKKKDDIVQVGSDYYTIIKIKSKYTHSLHESIDLIKNRFNDSSFKVYTVKPEEDTVKAFHRVIDDVYKNQDDLYDHYKQGYLTLGSIASLTGKNVIRCWEELVSQNVGFTSAPLSEENKKCKEVLDNYSPVIFDLSSLLTILHTNNPSLIIGIKNKKIVTQSTVNVIMEELEELNKAIKNGEYITVQKINGEYISNKITPELVTKRINHYQSLLDFINENFEVLIPSLTNDFNAKTEQDKIFGISFNESQILARELGGSICSDDFYFRRFSSLEPNSLFPFLSILNTLKDNEGISNQEWETEILKMIKLNYGTLPVNGNVIFNAYDADGYQIGTFAKRAVASLLHEKDIFVKAGVVSDFLKLLFINSQLADRISMATSWILNIYFSNSDLQSRDKFILLKMIDLKFRLIPLKQNELTDIINKLYPLS